MSARRRSAFQVSWTTISYRSVALAILGLAALCLLISYIVLPQPTMKAMDTASSFAEGVFGKLVGMTPKTASAVGGQQAHFTNLDGTVRVKKASSNTWIAADYGTPLEKGDVVQTSSEGMAKVIFADGSSYTVKQDSLIVVEDNSVNDSQQTRVAVEVTTGTVDLTTATFSEGSKSEVTVAGATASFRPESSAQVHNDPRADRHEILVKKGSADVARNGEVVRLSDYERVSFEASAKQMSKEKELGPPTLIGPSNMAPIFSTGKSANVQFTWTPLVRGTEYHIRISRNPYFSSTVLDTKSKEPQLAAVLPEGAYYWVVQTLDSKGHESVESEKNRFTIIPKRDAQSLQLELQAMVQHGHVIEVRGKTESNARVMVNGQEVPILAADGSFQYLTPPLPSGENVITVTAQNSKGAVNTQQKTVVIQ